MAGILASAGYKIVTDHGSTGNVSTSDRMDSCQVDEEQTNVPKTKVSDPSHVKWTADVWLLNSCTVKNPAEDHFKNYIQSGLSGKKKIILAGCVSQSVPNESYMKHLSIIGVQQIDRVIEVMEETLKGNTVRLLGVRKDGKKKTGGASLSLPKVRRNPLIEIIAISTGCLNQCTYCKTKHARGDLGSYSIEEIVDRAIESFKDGVKEIWLTSEDTGAYGRDIGTNLPTLLKQLIQVIPDGSKLRLGMTNPPYILDHLEQMAQIFNDDRGRIYKFLHIPVQSGSDQVLSDMKREYFRNDFQTIVDYLKKEVKGINIATDIICGFPTETEDDFEETMSLVEKYRFASLFINQFYPRPGTPAANMKRIPTQIVKNRSRKLSKLFDSYQPYGNDRIGKIYEILVTEESTDKKYYVGHNEFYEQILVRKSSCFLGRVIKVKIVSTGKWWMMGEPLTSESGMSVRNAVRDTIESVKSYSTWGNLWITSCALILTIAVIKRVQSL